MTPSKKPRLLTLCAVLMLMSMLAAQAQEVATAAGWVGEPSPSASALSVAGRLRELQADVERLGHWNDPRGVYAHCLCGDD